MFTPKDGLSLIQSDVDIYRYNTGKLNSINLYVCMSFNQTTKIHIQNSHTDSFATYKFIFVPLYVALLL